MEISYNENRMYNEEAESINSDELDQIVLDRLNWTMEYASDNSSYWEERFEEYDLVPGEIEEVEELLELPPLKKDEVLERQPPNSDNYDWLIDKEGSSNHMHCTSGTTGVEKWFFANEDDKQISNEAVRRGYAASDIDQNSVLANFLPKGLYMSGKQSEDAADGYVKIHQAFGHTNTPPRARVLEQFHGTNASPDSMFTSASTAERMARELEEQDLSPQELGVENIMLVGESSSEQRRDAISELYEADVTNNYATTETGFTAYQSNECDQEGMHVIEDLKLMMVVDEEEKELVEPGETGEVYITTLYPEGMGGAAPIFNYKPGDHAKFLGRNDCSCGRTHKMVTDVGRSDNIVQANQTKFRPQNFEDILHQDHYRDVLTGEYEVKIGKTEDQLDRVLIRADVREDSSISYEELEDQIREEFTQSHLTTGIFTEGDLLDLDVDIVDNGELEVYNKPGKPERIILE